MTPRHLLALLVLAVGALSGGTSAVAGEGARQLARATDQLPGRLNCIAYYALPQSPAIEVALFDDSDENLAIQRSFQDALRDAGFAASQGPALELAFTMEVIDKGFTSAVPNLGRLDGSSDSGIDLNVNIWSNLRDSMFGGRKTRAGRGSNQLHVNAVVRDRRSGRLLWQGDAFAALHTADRLALVRAMIAPLVQNLGRTVKNQAIQINATF